MTITTNADADLRIDPALRPALEEDLTKQGQHQDIEAEGKLNARLRRRKVEVLLPGADQPIMVDGHAFDGTAAAFVLDEPDVDETVLTLRKDHLVRLVHKEWWPFKARDAVFGLYPVMGPKGWAAVLVEGTHCMRCLGQHAGYESWPAECSSCGLTESYRNRVIEMLEMMRQIHEQPGTNRAQRRALKRQERRTSSGIVLPGRG